MSTRKIKTEIFFFTVALLVVTCKTQVVHMIKKVLHYSPTQTKRFYRKGFYRKGYTKYFQILYFAAFYMAVLQHYWYSLSCSSSQTPTSCCYISRTQEQQDQRKIRKHIGGKTCYSTTKSSKGELFNSESQCDIVVSVRLGSIKPRFQFPLCQGNLLDNPGASHILSAWPTSQRRGEKRKPLCVLTEEKVRIQIKEITYITVNNKSMSK